MPAVSVGTKEIPTFCRLRYSGLVHAGVWYIEIANREGHTRLHDISRGHAAEACKSSKIAPPQQICLSSVFHGSYKLDTIRTRQLCLVKPNDKPRMAVAFHIPSKCAAHHSPVVFRTTARILQGNNLPYSIPSSPTALPTHLRHQRTLRQLPPIPFHVQPFHRHGFQIQHVHVAPFRALAPRALRPPPRGDGRVVLLHSAYHLYTLPRTCAAYEVTC